MDFQTRSLPKRGNTVQECEDAVAINTASRRFALADGATEGYPSGPWAQMLANSFVEDTDGHLNDWPARLPAVQRQWDDGLTGLSLPWYGQEQLAQGAYATFLGVVLRTNDAGRMTWNAIAVGDTCLFHVRHSKMLCAFPLSHAEQFGTSPRLVGSRNSVEAVTTRLSAACRRCDSGDCLWMMTDALAMWFLQQHEAGVNPWKELEPLLVATAPANAFISWIEQLRDKKQLRNDDVTVLRINA